MLTTCMKYCAQVSDTKEDHSAASKAFSALIRQLPDHESITSSGLCQAGAKDKKKAHYTFITLTSLHRTLLTDAAQQWLEPRPTDSMT